MIGCIMGLLFNWEVFLLHFVISVVGNHISIWRLSFHFYIILELDFEVGDDEYCD